MERLPRILVIIGSGEMAPQMARVHRWVMARLAAGRPKGAPLRAAVIDTPYGFQENVASLLRADTDAISRESAYARVRTADFVFSGPGSPSYALRQWSATEMPTLFADKLLHRGALIMASAAALTLGRMTAPIYEIFKAGDDPRWLPGLDVLSAVGINAAVIPHWDNAEGSGHDTRYCFLGQRRFDTLERALPQDTYVLGVDEHTALVVDLDGATASVHGRGAVTIRRAGSERAHHPGRAIPLEEFTNADMHATRPASDDKPSESNLAARVVALEESASRLNERAALVEPLVTELLLLRAQARSMGVYEVADQIRVLLTGMGIEVTDEADGTTDFRLPD